MKKFIAIIAALAAVFGMTAMAAYAAPKVTEEQAKQTALKHAGLTPEQAQFKTIKYDGKEGRGRGAYKLRFYAGNKLATFTWYVSKIHKIPDGQKGQPSAFIVVGGKATSHESSRKYTDKHPFVWGKSNGERRRCPVFPADWLNKQTTCL